MTNTNTYAKGNQPCGRTLQDEMVKIGQGSSASSDEEVCGQNARSERDQACRDCKKIISKKSTFCKSCASLGRRNPKYKHGKRGFYVTLHAWVRKNKPLVDACENCHKQGKVEAANISNKYLKDINDYRWLCRKCHMESDGRLKNLGFNELTPHRACEYCKKLFQPKNFKAKHCSKKCYKNNQKIKINKMNFTCEDCNKILVTPEDRIAYFDDNRCAEDQKIMHRAIAESIIAQAERL